MAKVNYSLSTKMNPETKKAEIMIRFIGGRDCVYRAKSGLFVNPKRFSNGTITMPRIETEEQKELVKLKSKLSDLGNYLIEGFTNADKTAIKSDWLTLTVDKFRF